MENLYGISNSKVPKYSSLSPTHSFSMLNPYRHHLDHVVDQYLSHDTALKNLNSPNLRYMHSGSSKLTSPPSVLNHQPSVGGMHHHHRVGSRMESPRQSRSPLQLNRSVKVEEDVVVFDGVLVNDVPADRKSNKMDVCLSYLENSGFCHYGSKCQFAHGNQEQHPLTFSYNSMLGTPCKSYSITGTCSFGSKCRFLHNETSTPTSSTKWVISQIKPDGPISSIVKLKSSNWSPMDDIAIRFNQDFDSFVNQVLYGPRRINRLPVFTQICQE